MGEYDPITKIQEITYTGVPVGDPITVIPQPSVYQYSLVDSGEVFESESKKINKMRKGQKTSLYLGWVQISIADAAIVFSALNPKYVQLTYLDTMSGTWETKNFIVEERTASLYNFALGLWESVTFSLIQQDVT